jgi:hypothetical protein
MGLCRKFAVVAACVMVCTQAAAAGGSCAKQRTIMKNAQSAGLSLCDVLRSSERFNGRMIKVRATYRASFEQSELYCLGCLRGGRGLVWVEFDDLDRASSKRLNKALHNRGGNVTGTFSGVFHSGALYGHMAGYHYELVVHAVRDLVVVDPHDHLGKPPQRMSPAVRAKVCN